MAGPPSPRPGWTAMETTAPCSEDEEIEEGLDSDGYEEKERAKESEWEREQREAKERKAERAVRREQLSSKLVISLPWEVINSQKEWIKSCDASRKDSKPSPLVVPIPL
eukprot:TRINITY_DN178_c0_g2_i5.p1 TRINITY_DN178_c0_g2~~TRINITY_DN178_c0_g2_i5.p1  ORF type:complete len:109 (+),score=29.54 TRINITY_DN178_c0_g2_i5:252-578(+)